MKKDDKQFLNYLEKSNQFNPNYEKVRSQIETDSKKSNLIFAKIRFGIAAIFVFVLAVTLTFFEMNKIKNNKEHVLDGNISSIMTAKSLYTDELVVAYKSPTRNLTLSQIIGSNLLSDTDKAKLWNLYENKNYNLSLALSLSNNKEKVLIDDTLKNNNSSFDSNLNYSYFEIITRFEEQIGIKLSNEFLNNDNCGITLDFIENGTYEQTINNKTYLMSKYVEIYKLFYDGKIYVVQM